MIASADDQSMPWCAQEVLPSLLQVVNQPLRPVAQHLFTPQEKQTLAVVVATLVAYALTFDLTQQQQYGMPDGAGALASGQTPLAPAVHTLCSFPVSLILVSQALCLSCYMQAYVCMHIWHTCLQTVLSETATVLAHKYTCQTIGTFNLCCAAAALLLNQAECCSPCSSNLNEIPCLRLA